MIGALWLGLAVSSAQIPEPIHFDTEVIPVLTKAGCNSGACHGAAAGRGGFHLSLFGADPNADYDTIVHSLEGRRVNLARPESSLLLRKPTGQLEHGGDMALEPDGSGAERLLSWIRSGAPRGTARELSRLEVQPRRVVCDGSPADVQLSVTACFDEGQPIDVTPWTVFTAADPSSVTVDRRHVAHITTSGQHLVIARFLDRVVPIQILVPFSPSPLGNSPADAPNSAEPTDYIDTEILQTLAELRLPVSPPATDSTWLRRVTLDLTGRLPSPEEIRDFLAAKNDPDIRGQIVDRLLSSDAFADYWTLRFAKLLQMHSMPNDRTALQVYSSWLREELREATGLDKLAAQLLTSVGDSHRLGPANFHRMVGDARAEAELVGRFFAGVQFGCANCHNHPLDRWTQDDYHGLAAVFARIDRSRNVRLLELGDVTNLRTGEPAVPRIPGGDYLSAGDDHRQRVLEWALDRKNLYFATATTNRLWRSMFGRGLIEPPDDLRVTNPATHPDLLHHLTEDFAAHGYQIRHTLRRIALSQAYARSSQALAGNSTEDRFYSRAYSRLLEPEVLVDAIIDVTGVAEDFGDHAADRAVRVIDPVVPATALDVLGRCQRTGACGEQSNTVPSLAAQLHLMNGPLLNAKISDREGRLSQLLSSGKTDVEVIGEFYVRALGRWPDATELNEWQQRLTAVDADDRRRKMEDFLWALLNSREFRENH